MKNYVVVLVLFAVVAGTVSSVIIASTLAVMKILPGPVVITPKRDSPPRVIAYDVSDSDTPRWVYLVDYERTGTSFSVEVQE